MKRKKVMGIALVISMGIRTDSYAEQYEYDECSRVTKVIYDDGSNVTYTYDANGNITDTQVTAQSSKEGESKDTETEPGESGQPAGEDKDATGGAVDAGGNKEDSYVEQYEYDECGRVTKVIYDDGSNVTYTYDANGNIIDTQVTAQPPKEEIKDTETESGESGHPADEDRENQEDKDATGGAVDAGGENEDFEGGENDTEEQKSVIDEIKKAIEDTVDKLLDWLTSSLGSLGNWFRKR